MAYSDWYWEHGIQRTGEYQVSLGDWLYPISEIEKRHATASAALESRSAIAIWGQSQTGKSMLLSRYLDGENPDGTDSALSWDGGAIFRFAHSAATPEGTQCLNPVTPESDATSVVTRYVARESIPNVLFPVELKLLGQFQWLYAFAIGYLNKCELPEVKAFGETEFKAAMEAFTIPADEGPNRKAFETLFTLAEILNAFIESREFRFSNLGINNLWKNSIRSMMFNSPQLNRSVENVENFMSQLLWDSSPSFNRVVNEVGTFQENILRNWGNKPIFCSMEAAQLLLDFHTLDKCRPDSVAPDRERVSGLVRKLSWYDAGNEIQIGFDERGNLIGEAGLGCLQTLTAELQIPIRLDRIRNDAFRSLIRRFDLLDFPGVTNKPAGRNEVNKYRLDESAPEEARHILLTEISKYGKTLSMVFS